MAEEGENDRISLLNTPLDPVSDDTPDTPASEAAAEASMETPVETPVETPAADALDAKDSFVEHSLDTDSHEVDTVPRRRQRSWRTVVMWLVWASVYPCTLILIINEWANDSLLPVRLISFPQVCTTSKSLCDAGLLGRSSLPGQVDQDFVGRGDNWGVAAAHGCGLFVHVHV